MSDTILTSTGDIDTQHPQSFNTSVDCCESVNTDVVKKNLKIADLRVFIDAANVASRHAAQCGIDARYAWEKFAIARATASESTEALKVAADIAFDVYALEHKIALREAAVSDAAILEYETDLKIRCEALGVEMDVDPPTGSEEVTGGSDV
jgi:hypothetical protein